MSYLLPAAEIEWQDEAPFSSVYDDIYWHRGAATEEKQFVFIDPLADLVGDYAAPCQITVAELGFGFGVNCLLAAQYWSGRPANQRLNLVSIEKHPVTPTDLRRFLSQHSFPHTENLLEQYPPAYPGQHVIWLADNIRLVLIFGEAEQALADLDASVDAWFLDGFAPARNEEMWAKRLFKKMYARSRAGARLVTYSAAGSVKRGLEIEGFKVEKIPGFGRKKEMISATRPGDWHPASPPSSTVLIIGGGMAGLYCAEALQRRNVSFTIIDSGNARASDIPQLAMFPQLAVRPEARYRFSLMASQYMQTSPGFFHTGLDWHGRTAEEKSRLEKIADAFPDDLIESLDAGTVRFHHGGWLNVEKLRAHAEAETVTGHIKRLERTDHGWSCTTDTGTVLEADNVILATGGDRALLPEELQIRAIRGQAVTMPTKDITTVINGKVTIFPTYQGRSVVSGTYDRSTDVTVSDEDTRELLRQSAEILNVEEGFDLADAQAHVGIRAVSRDRLPVAGPMPDWSMVEKANRLSAISHFDEGLHLCTAFGSRGAAHARLCAEHVVSRMLGEPAALGLSHQLMLAPARFVMRDARTGLES